MKMFQEADFSDLEASAKLPVGYIIASVAEYPNHKNPLGQDLDYAVAVQLLSQEAGLMSRGTGETITEALEAAVRIIKLRGF